MGKLDKTEMYFMLLKVMKKLSHSRIIAYAMVVFLGLLSNNCGTSAKKITPKLAQEQAINRDLDSIMADGKLKVAIANSSSSYYIYRGQPMGYEYELLQILADSLNLELEIIVATDLDSIFDMLNNGECDLAAAHLTITAKRSELVSFTNYHATTRQVLVQRKPANYHRMSADAVEKELIREPFELIGKEVYVRKNSSYYDRLVSLGDEIGGAINTKLVKGFVETEELIEMVSEGKIDYTIADEAIADLNALYYGNIDVKTNISFRQKIGWAVRKNSPNLLKRINAWLESMHKQPAFHHLKKKYFTASKAQLRRLESDYNSQSGGKISEYDTLIQKYSKKINWDWRLLASVVYQESKFDNSVESWAGAKGLMQLMPQTALRFGINTDSVFTPEQSLAAGAAYLKWLDDLWAKNVADSTERIAFVLASYNAGHGHVLDAFRLAEKYLDNPEKAQIWYGGTEDYLLQKSLKKYYNDPIVRNGYCRCKEPVKYVNDILGRYNQYKEMIPLKSEEDKDDLSLLLLNH